MRVRAVVRLIVLAGALMMLALAVAPAAGAAPMDDYAAIRSDYAADNAITHCRWSAAQLQNARTIADSNPEDSYNGFQSALDKEIARVQQGGCATGPSAKLTFRLSVSPRAPKASRRTQTFRFRIIAVYKGKTAAVPGVHVRFAGKVRTTNRSGTATFRLRFPRAVIRTAVFDRARFPLGRLVVRIRR